MSNIYITEPPTSGRVLLSTSKGDLEVELWSKECPKACRNFIALALEGYYDEMVWHRIVSRERDRGEDECDHGSAAS